MNEQIKINTIPSLTWNWMKMNSDSVTIDASFKPAEEEFSKLPKGISIAASNENYKYQSGICNYANPKLDAEAFAPGANSATNTATSSSTESLDSSLHPVNKLIDETVKNKKTITIAGQVEEPLVIDVIEQADSVSDLEIIADADSEGTVIFLYKGDGRENVSQFIRTRVTARENSKLHIAKVQLLGKNYLQLDDTAINCEENAKVYFTQLELGGQHICSGLHVSLNGYKAYFESRVAYLCKEDQHLDMNHIVYHYGKKTECKMLVNGTLKDNSVKTYRGTIDFKNGCAGSKGNEMEETLLLNPKVVNKSLPVILCDEEDVEGEHGATIGRLSNDILFYMQTRGISQEEAERLMAIAKIQAAADFIPSDRIKEEINKFLEADYE